MMGKVKIKVKIIIQMGKVKIIKEKIQDKQTWWDMWGEMFHPDIFHQRIDDDIYKGGWESKNGLLRS